jgi:hypothetical protein
MRRRVLLYLTLIAVSACNGDNVSKPTASPTPPSADISDATHSALSMPSNPDFFFLPPMVKDPSGSSLWNAGAFNPALRPTVEICGLVAADTTQATAAACMAQPTVLTATVDGGAEQYKVNWKVPTSPTTFYRITVKVGTTKLGFADVKTGSNGSQLKNVATNDFITLVDGSTLPIKFRIEKYALCHTPGDPDQPCASQAVDLSTGGTVSVVLPNTEEPTGITIPSQGPNAPPATVTVQGCDDINPRVTDLRTFGPCFRVTADDGTSRSATHFVFTNPATVFSCEVDAAVHAAIDAGTLSAAQEPLVTLHRLDDAGTDNQRIAALQHVPACGKGVIGSTGGVRGMLASLRHGELRQATRRALALLAPKPAYASMFIDLGGGGFTESLSDFQFALPAKMQVVAGVDGQLASTGTTLHPTVKVTDLHGDPIVGATVHFGSVDATTIVGGTASAPWTIAYGPNALSVTGRGIASPDNDGPRDGFDPFQPVHFAFDNGASDGPEVTLGVGSLTFNATGLFAEGFEPVAESWTNTGYWHRSTLVGLTNVAVALDIVSPAPGDNSGGRLPAPFAGARALWFGSDDHGNFAGPLASQTQGGGTSVDPHSGVAASPQLAVPSTGSPSLTFRSWFEIESVNPSTFDVMEVTVQEVGGTLSATTRLNPPSDPDPATIGANIPLGVDGANTPPRWTLETVDLSAFKGKQVVVTFSFDTFDRNYNAFRGWVVDEVAVRSGTGTSASFLLVPLRAVRQVTTTTPPPARVWHP